MTSTPAASIRVRTSRLLLAGPSVATILVVLCMLFLIRRLPLSTSGRGPLFENLHRGKLLAFEEFEKSAAAGGNVTYAVLDPVFGDRRQRVAASGDGKCRRFGDRQRQRSSAFAEGIDFKHTDRAVPDDRSRLGNDGLQRHKGVRTDVQNHGVAADVRDRLQRRG